MSESTTNYEICPRCGKPYKKLLIKTIHGVDYAYAYHSRNNICYLGPALYYTYTSTVKGVPLGGLVEEDISEIVSFVEAVISRKLRGNRTNVQIIAQLVAQLEFTITELQTKKAQLEDMLNKLKNSSQT